MATVTYGPVSVAIGIMSWAEGIKLTKQFIGFVEQNTGDNTTTLNTIGAYFAIYAPHKVYVNKQLIEDGEHIITNGDHTFTLTLPLTVEQFVQLPGPLVGDWIEAATEENDWLIKRLDFMVSRIILTLNEPLPGSGPSSEPTKANAPTKTTG